MSLLTRVVLIIATALLPPLCMQIYNEAALRHAREADVREQALSEARAVAGQLDVIVAGVRNALVAMAEVPAIAQGETSACTSLLRSVNARFDFMREVELVDRDGRAMCDSQGTPAGEDRSGSDSVRLARARGDFAVGSFERDSADGPAFLSMGYPVRGPAGAGRVLVADIDLGWLRQQIAGHGLPPGAVLTVADRNGRFLVRLPDSDLVGETVQPEFRDLMSAPAPGGLEAVGRDGVRRIVGYVPLTVPPRDLFVSVGFSTARAYAASDAAALRGYALIAAGLAGALALAAGMVRGTITGPVRAILAATERWRAGNASARVLMPPARSEFGRIALAVNTLLGAVEAGQKGLRDRLVELNAVYDAAPVGLGFVDANLRYVTVNARLAEFNAVAESEHRGRLLRDVTPAAAPRMEPLLRRALAGEAIAPVAMTMAVGAATGAGAPPARRLLVGYQPAVAPDGHVLGVVIAAQDITALHRAEAALQETLQRANAELERRVAERTRQFEEEVRGREAAQAQLLQSQKMQVVGQLTGGIAHDFNNLLTAIIGNLELASLRAADREDISRLLRGAIRAADRGAALTQRMLAFGRRQYLRMQTVDVGALLEGLTDLLARSIEPRVEIRIAAPQGIRPARADPNQIELAVLNLAVNARDAMPDGGVVTIALAEDHVADPHSHPAGLAPGDYVRIAVSDTGIGMDADTVARAFEPFFTTKPVGRGSGLGLSMVQGFAGQSGGGAAIESAPGRGTTVTVWLPCAAAEAAPAETPPEPPPPPPAEKPRVLLVDDDDDVVAFATESLRSAGYAVTTAGDGNAALALLRDGERPDLLIADLAMPGLNGEELSAAARALHPSLSVLIATGYRASGVGPAGDAATAVLSKPFKAADLLARVAEMLGRPAHATAEPSAN